MNVQGPGGIVVQFPDGTDAATIDKVMRQATGGGEMPAGKGDRLPMAPGAVLHAIPPAPPDENALAASTSAMGQDLSLGLMDEAVAGAAAAVDPVADLFRSQPVGGSFDERYARHLANQRMIDASSRARHPVASVVGDVGAVAAMVPAVAGRAATAAVPLGTKMLQGAGIGAGYGAASGFGAGEGGLENRLMGAAEGGALGAATGGLLPIATTAAGAVLRPAWQFVQARVNPAQTAARIVDRAITAGGRDVGVVSRRLADAAARGDPLSLADVGGDQVQRLGRTVINLGGPGASALKTKINAEAIGQGARIADAVDQHLGVPGTTYQEAKHAIMDARSGGAEPHYRAFYQTPIPDTPQLASILNTPAGRAGLAAARTNSLNRRQPGAQWFVDNVTPEGEVIGHHVPNARALDEVRRTIRAQMEEAMASPAGQPFARPRDTPRSIAIRSVYNDLTNEMMAAGETHLGARNGPFAAANAAGLDNIQADEAIEFGRDIFKHDPRVIAQRMGQGGPGRHRVFNPGQQDLVRVGTADAVRQAVESGNFTANKLYKFFSSPEDINRLRPVFRTPADFQRFRREMLNEALKRKKLQAMTGNSTTAQQLADIQGTGNLEESMQTATDLLRGRPLAAAMGWLTRAARRNGILTPQVTDQIQRLISTRDIGRVQDIIRHIADVERGRVSSSQRGNAIRNALTAAGASQAGQVLAVKPSRP